MRLCGPVAVDPQPSRATAPLDGTVSAGTQQARWGQLAAEVGRPERSGWWCGSVRCVDVGALPPLWGAIGLLVVRTEIRRGWSTSGRLGRSILQWLRRGSRDGRRGRLGDRGGFAVVRAGLVRTGGAGWELGGVRRVRFGGVEMLGCVFPLASSARRQAEWRARDPISPRQLLGGGV